MMVYNKLLNFAGVTEDYGKSGIVRISKMELVAVKPQDRDLLWNINQKYLYEMTNFYDDEMDTLGNLNYGYFDDYFTDPKRMAFFLYDKNRVLVGFAMITRSSSYATMKNSLQSSVEITTHRLFCFQ